MTFRFELGDQVENLVTGMRGVVVARHEYLFGCYRYSVKPRGNKDGKPFDDWGADEGEIRIVPVESEAREAAEALKDNRRAARAARDPGGPRDDPHRPARPVG